MNLLTRHNGDAENHESHRMLRDIALLITGLGIGSGIALLLAPASGDEARYAIGRGCRKAIKHLGRHRDNLHDRAEGLVEYIHGLSTHGSRLLHFASGREA